MVNQPVLIIIAKRLVKRIHGCEYNNNRRVGRPKIGCLDNVWGEGGA